MNGVFDDLLVSHISSLSEVNVSGGTEGYSCKFSDGTVDTLMVSDLRYSGSSDSHGIATVFMDETTCVVSTWMATLSRPIFITPQQVLNEDDGNLVWYIGSVGNGFFVIKTNSATVDDVSIGWVIL